MSFTNLKLFLDHLANTVVPGNDCAVYKNGGCVFRYQSGYDNAKYKVPVTENLLYNMYSLTKPVTCTAALQLFENGAFLMDDSISEYLPEFSKMYVETEINGKKEIIPAKKPITVENLFTMTAGLTYDIDTPQIREVLQQTADKASTAEIVSAIAKNPLAFEPGEGWKYSLCHDVLGRLVEVVSGKKLSEYVKENITGPLGMNDTYFNLPLEKQRRMAVQYSAANGAPEEIPEKNYFKISKNYESGGAGLISSADDYIKFALALCGNGTSPDDVRILSAPTVELMRTNHLTEKQQQDFIFDGYGYGLGVRTLLNRVSAGSLSALGEFGWDGAAGSYLLVDPNNGVVIVYMQHVLNTDYVSAHKRIKNIVYASLF